MKKRKLLITMLILTLVTTLAVGLTSCDKKDDTKAPPKSLVGIEVVGNEGLSVNELGQNVYYIEGFDFNKAFNVKRKYSDGTSQNMALVPEMLKNPEDYDNIRFMNDPENTGSVQKTFKISYQGFESADFTFLMQHNPEITKEFTGVVFNGKEITYNPTPRPDEKRFLEVENLPDLGDGIKPSVIYKNNRNTNAGEYNVIAQISAPGYKTLELHAVLNIKQLQIKRPTFETDNKNPIPGEVEYNTRQQYVPIDRTNSNYRVSGDIAKKNAGTYTIKIELTNPRNYAWEPVSGSTELSSEPLEMQWKITKNKIDLSKAVWKYSTGFTSSGFFLYQDKPVVNYSVVADKFPRELVVADYELDEKNHIQNKQASNLPYDNYVTKVKFKVKDDKKDNYEIDESIDYIKEVHWAIRRNRIDPEGIIKFDKTEFVYNGEIQKPHLINVDQVISGAEIVDLTEGFRDVGDDYKYSVKIIKEGYEPLELQAICKITPKYLFVPIIENPTLYYNGVEQAVSILGLEQGIIVKGNLYGVEPNEYQLTFMLENTKNYKWMNAPANTSETDPITNDKTKWRISKITLPSEYFNWKPMKEADKEYNGEKKSIELNTLGTPGIKVTYDGNEKVDAGTYDVTAKIDFLYKEDVYVGKETFKTEYKDDHKGTFTIIPKRIQMGDVTWTNSTFIYRENLEDIAYKIELTGVPEDAPSDLFRYVNDGTYCNFVPLYDLNGNLIDKDKIVNPNNYKRTAKVEINPNYNPIGFNASERQKEWEIIDNPIGGIFYEDTTVTYNAEGYLPVKPLGIDEKTATISYYHGDSLENAPDYLTKDVGEYIQRIVIVKKGYSLFEKKIKFNVVPKLIEVPTVTDEARRGFTFDGTLKNCGIETNEEIYHIIGVNSAFKAGAYSLVIRLNTVINEQGNVVYNYEWANNTDGTNHSELTRTWKINPLTIDVNALNNFGNITNFSYNGLNQELHIKNLQKGIIATYETKRVDNKDCNGKAIDAGDYITTVTYTSVFKGDEKDFEKTCYTNYDKLYDAQGRPKQVTSSVYTISPQELDASGIRWRINATEDGKDAPAIYNENYKGVPQKHVVSLHINVGEDSDKIKAMFGNLDGQFVETQPKAGGYTVKVTFNDPKGNYKLVNNQELLVDSKNQQYLEFKWNVIRNDLKWISFNDSYTYIVDYDMEQETLTLKEQKPEYILADETQRTAIDELLDKDKENYSIIYEQADEEGNTYVTGPQQEVGLYKYRIKIRFKDYGQIDKIVTMKINRKEIARPTAKDERGAQAYTGKEQTVTVTDTAVNNKQIKSASWAYRIDYAKATEAGTYVVQAVLINDNFIWAPANAGEKPSTAVLDLLTWSIT